jgi:hypothetical protein
MRLVDAQNVLQSQALLYGLQDVDLQPVFTFWQEFCKDRMAERQPQVSRVKFQSSRTVIIDDDDDLAMLMWLSITHHYWCQRQKVLHCLLYG